MSDPLTNMIADGRLRTRPINHYGHPTIIAVDLEMLTANIRNLLQIHCDANIDASIQEDVSAYCDYIAGQTYNKLRAILKTRHPFMREERMNPRCPVPANMEFPAWISSTLSSIGPIRITDGPVDAYVCYATPANTAANYGRTNPPVFSYGAYHRLHEALKSCGVRMAPFDFRGETGSYYPTIDMHVDSYVFSAYGTVHHSHYVPEDFVRAAFVSGPAGVSPFENVGMRVRYVDDAATIDALSAAAAPDGIPAGETAASPGRSVGHTFNVNYFGIQPATDAARAGIYVIGRSGTPIYQCSLARDISTTEIQQVLRFRIFSSSPPTLTA